MRRALFVLAVLGGLCWLGRPAVADESGLRLAVTPSKASYAPGEAVSLTVSVTNRTGVGCRLATVADGTVSLVSVRRDGAAVAPSFGRVSYALDRPGEEAGGYRDLAPGQTLSFRVDAEVGPGVRLMLADALPGRDALTTAWPVSAAGHYTVRAVYRSPGDRTGEPDACTRSTDVATAEFGVGAPPTAGPPARWLVLVGAAGAVLVGVVVVLLVRRRGRRVAVLLLGVAFLLGAGATATPPARALIEAQGSPQFPGLVDYCLDEIANTRSDKVDYAAFVSRLRDPHSRRIVIKEINDPPGFKISTSWENGVSVTRWDPAATPDNVDGTPNTPCDLLFHEMLHADYYNMRADNPGAGLPNDWQWCRGTGLYLEEVHIIWAQNEYRALHNLPPRKRHTVYPNGPGGSGIVPDSIDKCYPLDRWPPNGWPPRPQSCYPKLGQFTGAPPVRLEPAACPTSGEPPAETNGDPHLVTFDNLYYDFQAVGEFVAARSRSDYEVQVRQAPLPFSADRTVSVNTAVALRVGGARVGFYLDHGAIIVHLDGHPQALAQGQYPLAGHGTISRRRLLTTGGQVADGYTVIWPDGSRADIDLIGQWGLRLLLDPAADRRGTLTGLLGNDDGTLGNDLRTRAGAPLPDHPSFDQLYHAFAAGWRVTPAESLFDYQPGQSTRTFTDLSFPEAPADPAGLPAQQRAEAASACRLAGVSDPARLADCVLDVARTGQVAFAVNAADTQDATHPSQSPTPPAPAPPPAAGSLGTLHDGDTLRPGPSGAAAGRISTSGERDRYDLDLGSATEFRLLDLTGDITVDLIGPDGSPHASAGSTLPGPDNLRLPGPGRYRMEISGTTPGAYGFQLVTVKPRTSPALLGQVLTDRHLDLPGRIDLYRFRTTGATAIQVTGTGDCGEVSAGLADDQQPPRVYTPFDLCDGTRLDNLDPDGQYLLVIWSDHSRSVNYSVAIRRA